MYDLLVLWDGRWVSYFEFMQLENSVKWFLSTVIMPCLIAFSHPCLKVVAL